MGFLSLCRMSSPQTAGSELEMFCPGAVVHLASAKGCLPCQVLLQAVDKEADVTAAALCRDFSAYNCF